MSVGVVHLSASFPRSVDDAVAPFLLDLLRAQRDQGWDVSAVAVHDAGLPGRQVLDGVPVRRARYGPGRAEVLAYRGGGHGGLRHPVHALLLPGLVLSLWWATWREVRRRRPAVLHAHWILPGGLVAALVPRRRGRTRLVVTLHGTDVELAASRLAGPVARWAIRRADAVCAVSEPLARRAESILGLPAGAVTVARLPLPPGVAPAPLPSVEGGLRLLAAGRASQEKGFDVLVAALARPEAAAWQATLITEGPERAALARAADPARVTFEDLVPRAALFEAVRRHHAVVVPSRTEGLGLFAVEALALGRPVVASRVGGLVEVVVDGDDGALVPPDDPDALARALGALAADLHPPVGTAAARHTAAPVAADHAGPYAFFGS